MSRDSHEHNNPLPIPSGFAPDQAKSEKRPGQGKRWLVRSLLVTAVVVIILCVTAFVYRERLTLELALHRLSNRDPVARQRAVSYVISRMGTERALEVIRIRMIGLEDNFFELASDAMVQAGAWSTALGDAWSRRVMSDVGDLSTEQRRVAAEDLSRLIWRRTPGHDGPHSNRLVQRLARDDAATVRYAALPAVGLLADQTPPDNLMRDLLSLAVDHPDEAVKRRASILIGLIDTSSRPVMLPIGDDPPDDPQLQQLALLEDTGDAFTETPVDRLLPPLLLLQSVRTSALAVTDDLLAVIESAEADLPQLGALIASRRFGSGANNGLALELVNEFGTTQHVVGAMLAALIEPEEGLIEALTNRAENSPDWATKQMARLALDLHEINPNDAASTSDEKAGSGVIDAEALLADRALPRTAVIVMLAHHGRLEGFDWLFAPVGTPPVDLSVALIDLRFKYAAELYLPGTPRLDAWANIQTIRSDIERLRMWYLLNRSNLVFDREDRVYRLEGASTPATPGR